MSFPTDTIQTAPATTGPNVPEESLATPTSFVSIHARRGDYSTRRIGPVTFEATNLRDAIAQILMAVQARSCRVFVFCNMHTFNLARRFPTFAAALSEATVFNDGLGIDLASLILFGNSFPNNLNGTDLTPALLMSLDRPVSVFLVGSGPGVAEQAAKVLKNRFRHVSIAGWHHGYFSASESGEIADRIREARTDLVLVGMGNPRQEMWAVEMAARSGAVMVCVGAFLDFASGRIRRAPRLVRAVRCEWLYRLAREPGRLAQRYIGGAAPFIWAILAERISLRHSDTSYVQLRFGGREEPRNNFNWKE
jgi:exopolysaccharide biosynthesis WecB/TagA/CpsF family protein